MTINLKEDLVIEQDDKRIILEKGDKIEILKENYGRDHYLVIRKTDGYDNDLYYELFDGASMPSIQGYVERREISRFEEEISKAIKNIFMKYRK